MIDAVDKTDDIYQIDKMDILDKIDTMRQIGQL